MKHVLLIMIAATTLIGCGPEKNQLSVSNKILFVDKGLKNDISIVRHVSDRIDGNLMRIRTQFRNRDDDALWIDIQVSWRDSQGFEKYKTNWASFQVPAGIVVDHDISSMNADVADYEFRIRSRKR